jgi:hypothetical protein
MTCLRKYSRPRGLYKPTSTVNLCQDTPPLSSTYTTTDDNQRHSDKAPSIQSASAAMSSDYEYSDDDGEYDDEDELMEEDDQG